MTIEQEPDGKPEGSEPELPAVEKAAAPEPKQRASGRKSAPRFKPATIFELIEHAYGEGGKKLSILADLSDLQADERDAEAEKYKLRKLAAADLFLAVPPQILIALAAVKVNFTVRRRILQLVLASLADHPVFLAYREQLAFPDTEPALSAQNVNDATQVVIHGSLGFKEAADFSAADRERMRVNAVTSFALLRVFRDGWPLERFVEAMASLVWNAPPRTSAQVAAAVLANVRSTDGLSQLSRHFEGLLADAVRQAEEAQAAATSQARRANLAEEGNSLLSEQLETERQRILDLTEQVAALTRSLEAERSNRVVDQSHHVDDYEGLRTRVIRRLTDQAELLNDGLHALRNGSTDVAEEFLDRSLTAIKGEVAQLRDMDGDEQ